MLFFKVFNLIVLCILVRGTSKKGHNNKGHKWPFSVCVNLKKDPYRHLHPRTNMHSTMTRYFFVWNKIRGGDRFEYYWDVVRNCRTEAKFKI